MLHINKSDYSIVKQKLYFVNTVENDSKISKPRLEVVFKPKGKKLTTDDFLVSEKNYFLRVGKQIKVANRFNDYILYKG